MKHYMLFFLAFIVLWMVVFLMAVTSVTSRADESAKTSAKECKKCREVYKKCLIKVIESDNDDEDARMQCDDAYYICFYKYFCQAGGR